MYRVVQKSPGNLSLRITFDSNKIESYSFHRSKEAVLLHTFMYYLAISMDHKIISQ
jgi:hypothetical protein